MSNDLTDNITELNGSVKNYVKARIDLFKLSLLKKTSRFATYIFSFLVVVMFATLVIAFGASAFAIWYGQAHQNFVEGVLIAGGGLILIAALFILFRKAIITTSVIRNFSEIMFEDEED